MSEGEGSPLLRAGFLAVASLGAGAAFVFAPSVAGSIAARSWPPFALVAGLQLIGQLAAADRVFDRAAQLTDRLRTGPIMLLISLLLLVAAVSTVLTLDTSAAFLTPVLVLTARRRGLDERPFLYGTLFMANSASLLLPGSNLTNLLVVARDHLSGAMFAARMAPGWAAAVVVTIGVMVARFRHVLRGARPEAAASVDHGRSWFGLTTAFVAAVLVLALHSPALPVFVVGLLAGAFAAWRRGSRPLAIIRELDVGILLALFGVAVALGTVGATWAAPAHLMSKAGVWETAVVGALVSIVVNNLPAAVLLASGAPAHPGALLLGLDVGPNLAVTGSLSALLWFRAARSVGSHPSARTVSRIGVVLVPSTLVVALCASRLFAAAHL